MKILKNVILGILFISLGVIFALNALDVTDIDVFFEGWWSLFVILPSVSRLISERDKTGSIIGLVIGVALLLSAQGIIDFSTILKLILPAVLIIIGVRIIFRYVFKIKGNA